MVRVSVPFTVNSPSVHCSDNRRRCVYPLGMDCRHVGPLGARWDYLTHDDTSGTGWIVCRECNALLERVTVAGGRFRGVGRYVSAFQEQIAHEAHAVDLRDLEVD